MCPHQMGFFALTSQATSWTQLILICMTIPCQCFSITSVASERVGQSEEHQTEECVRQKM